MVLMMVSWQEIVAQRRGWATWMPRRASEATPVYRSTARNGSFAATGWLRDPTRQTHGCLSADVKPTQWLATADRMLAMLGTVCTHADPEGGQRMAPGSPLHASIPTHPNEPAAVLHASERG
jgi:hypothetical protein